MAYQHTLVTALACSPDGTKLISGGSEGTVGVITSDNFCLYRYQGHEDIVRSLAFSPYGNGVASASSDKSVQVWDIITGKCRMLYTGHNGPIEAAAWSPDGRYIASCDQREMQVWEAKTGQLCFYRSASVAFSGVAWSSDGRYLAASTYGDLILVWDSTGCKICEYSSGRRAILDMVWSPSDHYLALSSDGFAGISILSLGEGGLHEATSYKGHVGATRAIAWSPDGQFLASASYEHLHIWTIGKRWRTQTIDRLNHHCAIGSVAWMPFGVAFGDEFGSVQVHVFGPSINQMSKVPQACFLSLQKDPDGMVHVRRPGEASVWNFCDESAALRWLTMNNAILLEASSRGHNDVVTGTYRMDRPTLTFPC